MADPPSLFYSAASTSLLLRVLPAFAAYGMMTMSLRLNVSTGRLLLRYNYARPLSDQDVPRLGQPMTVFGDNATVA